MVKGLISVLIILFGLIQHSHAETSDSSKELTLGVFPYISSTRLIRLYMPLTEYLESKTNKKVRLLSAPDFKTFVQRTESQQYDIIYTAPHFALLAEQQKKYKRLSRFSRDLTATLFVNKDSPITRIEELEGKTISMPDKLAIVSAMGEVHLRKKGLKVGQNVSLLNTPTHNNAIISVKNNTASAGIIASPVFDIYNKKNKGKLKPIEQTKQVPSAMFMVSTKVGNKDSRKLNEAMGDFTNSKYAEKFFAGTPMVGVKPISDTDMRAVAKYVDLLKQRL